MTLMRVPGSSDPVFEDGHLALVVGQDEEVVTHPEQSAGGGNRQVPLLAVLVDDVQVPDLLQTDHLRSPEPRGASRLQGSDAPYPESYALPRLRGNDAGPPRGDGRDGERPQGRFRQPLFRARLRTGGARDRGGRPGRVASAIGASPAEIVFTGGGTEADNLAIKGAARKLRGNGNHIITTAFEHHAVLDTVEWLGHNGFETTVLPVGPDGLVDPAEVAAAVKTSTTLVSVMAVNNEIGTAQPLAEIVRAVKDANPSTLVHTDAVQMLGNLPVDVHEMGLDFAAFSAHKLGGPKGVGFLFARSHTPVEALLHGGGHEGGLRSGTLNVPGLAGLGVAAEIAVKEVDHKIERVGALRTRLWQGIDSLDRPSASERTPDRARSRDAQRQLRGRRRRNPPVAVRRGRHRVLRGLRLSVRRDRSLSCSARHRRSSRDRQGKRALLPGP